MNSSKHILSLLALCLSLVLQAGNKHILTQASGSSSGSLPALLAEAASGDTVIIPADLGEDIVFPSDVLITKNIHIQGNGNTLRVEKVSASKYRLFTVESGSFSIENCVLMGGRIGTTNTEDHFGGILSVRGSASLKLEGVSLYGGLAYHGGALFARTEGEIAINRCSFSGNQATTATGTTGYGGAIYLHKEGAGNEVIISNTQFNDNFGRTLGGAIMHATTFLSLYNCSFTANVCEQFGGAIVNNTEATLVLESCYFGENTSLSSLGSAGSGGAVFSKGKQLQAINCTFYKNKKASSSYWAQGGGAVYVQTAASFDNCTFVGNEVEDYQGSSSGAALFASGSEPIQLNNCLFAHNYLVYTHKKPIIYQTSDIDVYNSSQQNISGRNNLLSIFGPNINPEVLQATLLYTTQELFTSDVDERNLPCPCEKEHHSFSLAIGSGSLAAGAGATLTSTPLNDQWGIVRNYPPSIGAYEASPSSGIEPNKTIRQGFYPNPAKDKLYFYAPQTALTIRDVFGRVVLHSTEETTQLSIAHLAKGIYFVQAAVPHKSVWKLVIE